MAHLREKARSRPSPVTASDRLRSFNAMHAKELIGNWVHDDAKAFALSLVGRFGTPNLVGPRCALWYDVSQFSRVYVKDESIPHDFPAPHRDFVYAFKNARVTPDMVGVLAHVTGSVFVDLLKQEAGGRCGDLIADSITVQFVADMAEGRVPLDNEKAKKEYGRRIKSGKTPDWYKKE